MAKPTFKDVIQLVKQGMTIEAQEKIMELREAMLNLQEENQSLRERVHDLEAQLEEMTAGTFPPCPSCGRPGWRVVASEEDAIMGVVGILNRKYECSFCQFTETLKESGDQPSEPHFGGSRRRMRRR